MPKGKVVRVERSQALLYLGKAREFFEQAGDALEAGRSDAAMLCAIHAAISGADAVTAALLKQRSTDPDHFAAADLLRAAGRGSGEIESRAKQLIALVQKKNLVEYEARRATRQEANDAAKRSERFVEWADKTTRAALGS